MKRKRSVKKIIGRCVLSLLVLAISGILFIFMYIIGIDEWQDFEPQTVSEMSLTISLYDDNEELYLKLYSEENREYALFDEIPKSVIDALIATEDTRFYEHGGFDPVRMLAALFNDMKSGSFKEGASTITQQLVKTSELSYGKTVKRKLAEIIMAAKLEKEYSKEEILELYLNRVPFGGGAYGIKTAAAEFLGKDLSELTPAGSALLVGMLKAPARYDPRKHQDAAFTRKDLVLKNMYEAGYLTAGEYAAALKEKIVVQEHQDMGYPYGWYTDMVLLYACKALNLSYRELQSGGYKIYTYLDTALQTFMEAYAKDPANFPENAEDGELCQTAGVVLDSSGGIKALIGGREHTARLSLSRATAMKRQPGSAIKPVLVYAPAIEYLHYSPVSLLLDEPTDFSGYTPRNSGKTYRGWVSLRDCVAYSINIPAVSLLREVGLDKAKSYASTVGIEFSPADDSLTLALGGFSHGVSPLELAGAYLPFSSGGYYQSPSLIKRIEDAKGNVIYERGSEAMSVLSPESAYIMSSLLSSVVEYGTAQSLQMEGVPLAAKTGTSTYDDAKNNKDAWTVAFNSEYVVCCWIGFDKTDEAHTLKQGTTGGTYPAAFTKAVFQDIYKGASAPAFTQPEGIIQADVDKSMLTERLTVAPPENEDSAMTECFTADTLPANLKVAPENIAVTREEGRLTVTYSGYADYQYIVERRKLQENRFVAVGSTRGGGRVEDVSAEPGQSYIYRIRAVGYPDYSGYYLYLSSPGAP